MKIYPAFDLARDHNHHSFIASMEQLLEELLPADVLKWQDQPESFFQHLSSILPLICFSQLKKNGNAFGVTVLSHAEYTHGTGRFLSDALSRRFIPGKIVELVGTRTLSFCFFPNDTKEFLISERWIMANCPEEIEFIQQKLPSFIEELRLTFLCIVKSRHFISLNAHKIDPKALFLPEIQHPTTFEQVQQIIQRLAAEKTIGEIRSYIAPFCKARPKIFDRNVFEEIKSFIPLYHEKFIGSRKVHGVSRLVCYHFYFQKHLAHLHQKNPITRHLLLKIFRSKETLGILVLLSLFKENEILKKPQILEAIRHCIPECKEIENSFLMDSSSESHLFFYIEIRKENTHFTSDEVLSLRTKLPLELKACIQRKANPLFMLCNQEDRMRYLIALAREIRYVKDIPQLVISFEEQTEEALIFSVMIVRVLKSKTSPIKDLISRLPFRVSLREQKTVGLVRNKYLKEASIFKVSLPKEDYLRKDHALDLPKARQTLLMELNTLFHEVRDYNGGLLSKQLETLQILKELLRPIVDGDTFDLENFFFSIEPLSSQMTLPPPTLEEGFLLLLDLIKTKTAYKTTPSMAGFALGTAQEKENLLSFLEATRETFQEISYSLTHLHDLFFCIVFFSGKNTSEQHEIRLLLHSFLKQDLSIPRINATHI